MLCKVSLFLIIFLYPSLSYIQIPLSRLQQPGSVTPGMETYTANSASNHLNPPSSQFVCHNPFHYILLLRLYIHSTTKSLWFAVMFASGGNFTRLQPWPNVVHDGNDTVPTLAKTDCICRIQPSVRKLTFSFFNLLFLIFRFISLILTL